MTDKYSVGKYRSINQSGEPIKVEEAVKLLNEQHDKIEECTSWERALLKLLEIATKKITKQHEQIAELNEALVFEQEASTEKDERIKMLEIEVRNNQRLYRP